MSDGVGLQLDARRRETLRFFTFPYVPRSRLSLNRMQGLARWKHPGAQEPKRIPRHLFPPTSVGDLLCSMLTIDVG